MFDLGVILIYFYVMIKSILFVYDLGIICFNCNRLVEFCLKFYFIYGIVFQIIFYLLMRIKTFLLSSRPHILNPKSVTDIIVYIMSSQTFDFNI